MTVSKRAWVAAVAGACALAVAGCGSGGSGPAAAAPPSPTPTSTAATHDFSRYDLFIAGTATGDPAESQLFGVNFSPLTVDRLSTDSRIRSFAADADHVVVSFADGQVLKLAQLTNSGELTPIPGLGEPDALYPQLRDGVLYFGDSEGKPADHRYRYFSWDPAGQHETTLFSSAFNEHPKPAGDGRFVVTEAAADGTDDLVVRDAKGEVRRYPLHVRTGAVRVGRDYAAATTIEGKDAETTGLPDGLILVDLATGRTTRVPKVLVLSWNPDGSRLLTVQLVAASDGAQHSRLALLDPTQPHAPQQTLQTIPFPVYEGVWVRGELPS